MSEAIDPDLAKMTGSQYGKYRQRRRTKLAALQYGLCAYCFEMLDDLNVTLDEIVPRIRRGTERWGNSVAACVHCNTVKGSIDPVLFSMLIAKTDLPEVKVKSRAGRRKKREIKTIRARRQDNIRANLVERLPKPLHCGPLAWPQTQKAKAIARVMMTSHPAVLCGQLRPEMEIRLSTGSSLSRKKREHGIYAEPICLG